MGQQPLGNIAGDPKAAAYSDEDHRDLNKLRADALAAAEFYRRAPSLATSADAIIDLYCAIARVADVIAALDHQLGAASSETGMVQSTVGKE